MNKPQVIKDIETVWEHYRSAGYVYAFAGACVVLVVSAIGSKLFG